LWLLGVKDAIFQEKLMWHVPALLSRSSPVQLIGKLLRRHPHPNPSPDTVGRVYDPPAGFNPIGIFLTSIFFSFFMASWFNMIMWCNLMLFIA
jgi:hypothetical protein